MEREECACAPRGLLVSLDSLPPYVYCAACKKPVLCKVCGAPTAGECYPPHDKEPRNAA